MAAAQAQKHVTHNEALEILDAIAQLTLQAVDQTVPPATASDGEVWAIGPGAVNQWAGHDTELALWSNGGWLFVMPRQGWSAEVDGALRVFDGATWVTPPIPDLQNLPGVGINTGSDATNVLAVDGAASLFFGNGTGHQLKINKAASSDTASVLFQTNWDGRAELGTLGNDAFGIKVSPDGSAWTTALSVDQATATLSGNAITQSPIDTTAGRLLKVGDFGVGSSAGVIMPDLNDQTLPSGLYFCAHGTTANNLIGGAPKSGSVLVMQRSNGARATQLLISEGFAGEVFQRSFNSTVGGWSSWNQLFNSASLLGSVSHSGGVPTGAVIERGSNSNGEYVRFADGTQICWVGQFTTSATEDVSWVFPAAFTYPASPARPVVSGWAPSVVSAPRFVQMGGLASGTQINVRIVNNNWARVASNAHLMSIGRWF